MKPKKILAFTALGLIAITLVIVIINAVNRDNNVSKDYQPTKTNIEYWTSSSLLEEFKGIDEAVLKTYFGEPDQIRLGNVKDKGQYVYYNKELIYSHKFYKGKKFDLAVFTLDKTGVIDCTVRK